jgi:hypothetical protein
LIKNKNFLKRLSELGFPLFEIEEKLDANITLTDIVKIKDLRIWEGFPVVLANSAEKNLFNYRKAKRYLNKPSDKFYFDLLILMSFALYKSLNIKFYWAEKLYDRFLLNKKKDLNRFLSSFKKNQNFKIGKYLISSQRVKSIFNNYFVKTQTELDKFISVKEELSLEYALSQIFSPKQKELFLKKLKREKLTKTEREYFSRRVRKKVVALANPKLYQLAQRLLEEI